MGTITPIRPDNGAQAEDAAELEALRKEVGWLRAFADLSADWFWEQDAEFRFVGFTGHSTIKLAHDVQPFVGKRRWEMPLCGVTQEQLGAHIACCARHEVFRDFEYDIPSTDGEAQRLSISGAPMFDSVGGFTGYRGIGRNITDVYRIRRALEEREAAMAALLRDYSLIFDNTLIGISYQRNRVIERCNRRLEEIFGWGPGELIGRSTRVLYDSDRTWQAIGARVYSGADTFDGELNHVRKDGTPITVHIVGRAMMVAGESVWVWTYDDVTEKNRERERHERLLGDYAMIFENSQVGMTFAKDRVFLRCNRQMEEMFGYPPGGLLGQSSRLLYFSEQEWNEVGLKYKESAGLDERIEMEVRFRRNDGEALWARVSGRRISNIGGESWVWSYQDVTRRRLVEEELRQSYADMEQRVADRTRELSQQLHFMQELIEAIPGPVFYKSRAGEYLGCNQAFADFLGLARENVIGHTVYDLSPKELADKYFEADEALFLAGSHQIYETKVKAAAGEQRDVMFQKAVYHDAEERVAGLIGVMLDITDRIAMETQLRQSATVFDSTADGVLIADSSGAIVAVNRAFSEITGYGQDEVLGRNPRILQSGRQGPEFYKAMWDIIATEGRWRGELWNRRKDGTEFVEWLTINAVKDKTGSVTHYVAVFSDVTPMKMAQERLDYQAHHDALTGLPNRLLFEDRISKVVSHARRAGTLFALLFVDLDRFKIINDTLGHHVGDVVLIEVAKRFESLVRESDTVARLGGDEFIIIIEDIAGPTDASRVADKILDSLSASIVGADQEFFVGASIGISLFPSDGEDAASLLKAADSAMYRAKDRGRNTYEFVAPDLTEISLERFQLEVDIRHAINRNELRPYFQAQYSLQTDEMIGAEALLRWLHPKLGMVSPVKFIPLAEESGLIVELGAWILRESCCLWANWIASGFRPGVLSVNVSGVEFRRGHVYQSVCSALEASGLEARYLSLEITESAIMNQAESSIRELRALRELGVQLAIDDFGTGYSSLSYLKRLPLDKLKIDQGFVRGLPADEEDAAITRAVVALAHSLQFKTIAEGVETEAQRELLKTLGCDEMQGFLKARPVPAADFEATILRSMV